MMIWLSMAWAACPTTNRQLEAVLMEPVDRYVQLDVEGFKQSLAKSRIDCVESVVTQANAVEVHTTRGLDAFVEKDFGLAEAHFGAARLIRSTWTLADEVAPAGHPLRRRSMALVPDVSESIPVPKRGGYRMDGEERLTYDPRLPFVFQRVTPSGRVRSTEMWVPGDLLPSDGEVIRDRPPLLLIGGAASVGLGVAAYGGALGARSSYRSKEQGTQAEFDRLFRLNQGLTVTSVGLTSLGTGLLVAHLLKR